MRVHFLILSQVRVDASQTNEAGRKWHNEGRGSVGSVAQSCLCRASQQPSINEILQNTQSTSKIHVILD